MGARDSGASYRASVLSPYIMPAKSLLPECAFNLRTLTREGYRRLTLVFYPCLPPRRVESSPNLSGLLNNTSCFPALNDMFCCPAHPLCRVESSPNLELMDGLPLAHALTASSVRLGITR